MDTAKSPALLRRYEVEARTGLSRSTLFALVASGDFPKPIELHGRTRAWVESDVSDWIAAKIQAGRRACGAK